MLATMTSVPGPSAGTHWPTASAHSANAPRTSGNGPSGILHRMETGQRPSSVLDSDSRGRLMSCTRIGSLGLELDIQQRCHITNLAPLVPARRVGPHRFGQLDLGLLTPEYGATARRPVEIACNWMCIGLVATSHPKYAVIALDSREEYILRPTSRPHFWTHQPSGNVVLSSRDLLRREHGTWMGITRSGRLAILTNFRETVPDSDSHQVYGLKSRGEIVNAWLGAPANEDLDAFVGRMVGDRVLTGVGGFSLICGDLRPRGKDVKESNGDGQSGRRELLPMAVISNRSEAVDGVPRIAGKRGDVWGLSNTIYEDPPTWPKIIHGRRLVKEAVDTAVAEDADEERLVDLLFSVLDTNMMPPRDAGVEHEKYVDLLKNSIFCPAITDEQRDKDMAAAVARGKMKPAFDEIEDESREAAEQNPPGGAAIFDKGAYGTQRQTIILVDWEGRVTYIERALWDAHGNPIERGKGDVKINFDIEGWN
ncbi:hypothetical protein JX266_010028 [Neoarthrinium moseri]|uniref:uncharacterized protein n=1 Tax=Neoarthrinium moseri TaxID=1658444 RepID=UPI001FDC8D77|nr:uncharacterized protein JN550_004666 [Neoarthrinium moseri]KAI1843769.1 hypothetical protein JX266_010028 [Neoarthrinium moseri]KAI1871221.1 hypothetical protein JN550_004666 [Neoarthrinium moseri]